MELNIFPPYAAAIGDMRAAHTLRSNASLQLNEQVGYTEAYAATYASHIIPEPVFVCDEAYAAAYRRDASEIMQLFRFTGIMVEDPTLR